MENASKALLIAAAILIVIVLIGVAVGILNSSDTSSQVDSTTSAQEMQMFNAQFTGYLGSSRAAATIPNLLAIVNRSNDSNTQHDVTIVAASADIIAGAATAAPTKEAQVTAKYTTGTKFVNNAKYSITATYDADGYIYAITIN